MMRGFRDDDTRNDDAGDVVTFADSHAMRETEQALQCEIDGKLIWIPKSVIDDDSEVFDATDNKAGKLIVKGWFARKEGLVE